MEVPCRRSKGITFSFVLCEQEMTCLERLYNDWLFASFPFDWSILWSNKNNRVLKMHCRPAHQYKTEPFSPLLIEVIQLRVCLFGAFDFTNHSFGAWLKWMTNWVSFILDLVFEFDFPYKIEPLDSRLDLGLDYV